MKIYNILFLNKSIKVLLYLAHSSIFLCFKFFYLVLYLSYRIYLFKNFDFVFLNLQLKTFQNLLSLLNYLSFNLNFHILICDFIIFLSK